VSRSITLFFIALLILIPEIAGAALSLEALAMVEDIRRKLATTSTSQNEEIVMQQDSAIAVNEVSSDVGKEYVVGAELRQALQRYRKAVYGQTEPAATEPVLNYASSKTLIETTREKTAPKQSEAAESYTVGRSLRRAIDRVKSTRPPDDMCEDVIAVDAAQYIQQDTSSNSVASQNVQFKQNTNTEVEEGKNDDYEKSSFVKNMRLKSSETDPMKDEDNSSEKSQAQKTHQDKKLNQEIRRHEFRMPGNYRIIVK
jgi:hypothetical protein